MSISIVHDDPVIEQCGYCDNGIQGDQYCRYCGGDGFDVFDLSALATLGHNLAVGAGLCRAFVMGLEWADAANIAFDVRNAWRPGCGRSAS